MKSIVLKPDRAGLKFLFCLSITFLLLFMTVASPANAKVEGWAVNPENPNSGDILTISGLASPEEEIEVSVSFEKTVPVYLREYAYEFENIEILNFNNLFTVRAEGVEDLKAKMKMVLAKTESAPAENGIATVSFSGISPGEYKVRVDGTAEDGASGINLKVATVQRLKAGKDGRFSYRYGTESVPSGKLEIKLGNSEREIVLNTKGNAPALQTTQLVSSKSQVSGKPEVGSEPTALTVKESTDKELTHRENEEKQSISLTQSSWDENNSMTATSGEVPSKGVSEGQEIRKQEKEVINFFYLLAGILAGIVVLLTVRRKK
jgi:hypothetical protein